MNGTPFSALPPRTPRWALDPYRFHGLPDLDHEGAVAAVAEDDDYVLPAPCGQRPSYALAATDKRRLDLHAALTTAGLAPRPGDLEAIGILSGLDDTTVGTVLRWITRD
ncbi:hypothetical protein [Streptomyces agglomeratus]|uniref:hypothetical protein n=1 Tax=Streptomyces agglomeratus TaxID=285458 RepID=UPI0009A05E77|nr:hypothetical protein [Streptomyces agglomeratus]